MTYPFRPHARLFAGKRNRHQVACILLFLAFTSVCWGQDDCFNPDLSNDGNVGAADLILLLSYYDMAWPLDTGFTCPSSVQHQGHDYDVVQIGDQCWFAENVRVLPQIDEPTDSSSIEPRYYVYWVWDGVIDAAHEEANYANYGALYNFPAVQSGTLCPAGWHVPTLVEWDEMLDLFGGASIASSAVRAPSWSSGTNESGLSLLPGGFRSSFPNPFALAGNGGYYWTSSEAFASNEAWDKYMYTPVNPMEVAQSSMPFEQALSVRCIEDSE